MTAATQNAPIIHMNDISALRPFRLTAFFAIIHNCQSLSTGFRFNGLPFLLSFSQCGFTFISS